MSEVPPIMKPDRLSVFTDGVIAIIITIMVLELKVPEGTSWAAVRPTLPLLGAYALSFVNVAIFWNNHHHLMHLTRRVDGRVLWANLFLLFWLSLIPFVIRWIGEAKVSAAPVAAYGAVLTMAALAYLLLEWAIIHADVSEDGETPLDRAVGKVKRERITLAMYLTGAALAFVEPWLAVAIYVAVSLLWFMPDRRVEQQIEQALDDEPSSSP